MHLYGLIGKKLAHSFSPPYFRKKFRELGIDAQYEVFELDDISQFPELIAKHNNLKGLNVTIPYKKEVIRFIDNPDETSGAAGAVNTISIDRSTGKPVLYGFNTDVIGFEKALKPLIGNRNVDQALILGTGGAAQSVAFVLEKINIPYRFVSRTKQQPDFNYHDLTKEVIGHTHLIINTTPLGMFPKVDEFPDIPYESLTKEHVIFDLIYNPTETLFLKKARQQGALTSNGLKMLEIQADEAWKIWQRYASE